MLTQKEHEAREPERKREQRALAARLAVDSGATAGAITRIARVIDRYIETGEVER